MFGPSRLSAELEDMTQIVETDSRQALQKVTLQCDWVIADENSNVNWRGLRRAFQLFQ